MSDSEIVHTGGCFCRAVSYRVTGRPVVAAFCHCSLCQRLNAAAFILTTHWNETNFTWTHSETPYDVLDYYDVKDKPWKRRWRCKSCGCTVASFNDQPQNRKWSVWGGQFDRDAGGKIIGWDTVKPTAHIFYETRMVDVHDELGKWTGYEGKSERIA